MYFKKKFHIYVYNIYFFNNISINIFSCAKTVLIGKSFPLNILETILNRQMKQTEH